MSSNFQKCTICSHEVRLQLDAQNNANNYFIFEGKIIAWCTKCIRVLLANNYAILKNEKSPKELKDAVNNMYVGIKNNSIIKFKGISNAELYV